MEKKKNHSMNKYKKYISITLIILFVVYIMIYLIFKGDGFLYVGKDLSKKDWLSFLGAYLAFSGTLLVSIIATMQSAFYKKVEEEKEYKQRIEKIKPIFSVTYCINEIINKNDIETAKQKVITISIENVNDYPIRNVCVFDKYLYQLLKAHEKKDIKVIYSDWLNDLTKDKGYIVLYELDYERNEIGLPSGFNINYEDIDGNDWYQSFKLSSFDETLYYSFDGIENADK